MAFPEWLQNSVSNILYLLYCAYDVVTHSARLARNQAEVFAVYQDALSGGRQRGGVFGEMAVGDDDTDSAAVLLHTSVDFANGLLADGVFVALALHGDASAVFDGNQVDAVVAGAWCTLSPIAVAPKEASGGMENAPAATRPIAAIAYPTSSSVGFACLRDFLRAMCIV